jgi:hypothetical protein
VVSKIAQIYLNHAPKIGAALIRALSGFFNAGPPFSRPNSAENHSLAA